MWVFGTTVALGAFLLFLIQPLIGRYLLPSFGGSPAVWSTCLLFFQTALLGGYLYAHVLVRRVATGLQGRVHLVLLLLSLGALAFFPPDRWQPDSDTQPTLRILAILLPSIGAPFLLLSSTGPLLQTWFAGRWPGRVPWRLYSFSNLGSLIALLVYPIAIEPGLSLPDQARAWSWAYVLFVLACALPALGVGHGRSSHGPIPATGEPDAEPPRPDTPSTGDRILWFCLPACASLMLLASTHQISQDLAVVPLLWVVPLAIYLLSFIVCFQGEGTYSRPWFGGLLAAALVLAGYVMLEGVYLDVRVQVAGHALVLFACSMVCHGELYRLRPPTAHLTSFYLHLAAGGAAGGLFVTLLAPSMFPGYWEYHLGLAATLLLLLAAMFRDPRSSMRGGRHGWAWAGLTLSWVILAGFLAGKAAEDSAGNLIVKRNFFGILRVIEQEKDDPSNHRRTLMHGRIEHGHQFVDPEKGLWPTSYYGPLSGIGLAIRHHPERAPNGGRKLRVGVVGLGIGTIAAYGEEDDVVRFYEIDGDVEQIARRHFTYCSSSPSTVEVVLGDARVSLERERRQLQPQRFDVLAVDAFTGDAVPVHLLTRESLETYLYHLKPDGVLAFHISNRYFDLSPVIRGLAGLVAEQDFEALRIYDGGNRAQATDASEWVLLSRNPEFLRSLKEERPIDPWPQTGAPLLWTDDYSNLLRLLRRPKSPRP